MPKLFKNSKKSDSAPDKKPEKKMSKKELKALQEEAEARIAEEKINAEREALMQLSEKELLVEILLALRGYDDRFSKLEKQVRANTNAANLAALNSVNAALR